MKHLITNFDGSTRKPRDVQATALQWLMDGYEECPVHVISGPVGCGKSAIARAIQQESGAYVVIPSNILMDQYTDEYRNVNYLKGKTHYRCQMGLSCSEWCDVLEQKACVACPYQENRRRAREGAATFFNPMSLYYLLQHSQNLRPSCIVVDEAHQLPQMVLQLCSKRFQKSVYGFTDQVLNEVFLTKWLANQILKLQKLANLYQNTGAFNKVAETSAELEIVGLVKQGMDENPQNYALWLEQGTYRNRPETFLNVKAIRPPQFMMHKLLDSKKLVLMSGTLFKTDIEELAAGRTYRYIDLPSPIPKERRPILYRPTTYKMNVATEAQAVVSSIEKVLDEFPNRNSVIHTTYDRAKKFAPLFKRPVLVNTPDNKAEILDRFKRKGGVFLASGCAEGLDLRDDLCRLNIIPHFVRPSLVDPVVAKRRALDDGERWFALEAFKTCIQQYGRSTRHERDASTTVVLDPTFGHLVRRYRKDLPNYFLEAIKWSGQ